MTLMIAASEYLDEVTRGIGCLNGGTVEQVIPVCESPDIARWRAQVSVQ